MSEQNAEYERQWDRWTEVERKRLLDWIAEACLLHGSSLPTAYLVAGQFGRALDDAHIDRYGAQP